MDAQSVVGRLTDYNDVMIARNFTRARILWAFWLSFNDLSNPLRDIGLRPGSVAPLLNNLAYSACNETMLIVARMFDQLDGQVLKSDRISFDVMAALYRRPGVREELVRQAVNRENGRSQAANGNDCKAALDQFERSLSRLRKEQPNRVERFRVYRHRYLAHTLNLPEAADPPLYGDIEDMLTEAGALLSAGQTALRNSVFKWDYIEVEAHRQSATMWMMIRNGHIAALESISTQK